MADTDGKSGKGLNIGLWVAQVLLFLAFGAAGGMKLFSPAAVEMAKQQLNMPYALTYFIGVSEFAGALGMILPAATRIQPKLTGFAGIGLLVVMILALGVHIMRGELSHMPPVIILGALGLRGLGPTLEGAHRAAVNAPLATTPTVLRLRLVA